MESGGIHVRERVAVALDAPFSSLADVQCLPLLPWIYSVLFHLHSLICRLVNFNISIC